MPRTASLVLVLFYLSGWILAQQSPWQQEVPSPPPNQAPTRSHQTSSPDRDVPAEESSSSKDTKVDISPPKDDAKNHPHSSTAVAEAEGEDVQEFHPWDPHRAAKDVEVGDFYFKRKNYHAAADRYREALLYKPNDAIATFRLAECQEKLGQRDEARTNYEGYLKILPEGPFSAGAHKALDRLKKTESESAESGK